MQGLYNSSKSVSEEKVSLLQHISPSTVGRGVAVIQNEHSRLAVDFHARKVGRLQPR